MDKLNVAVVGAGRRSAGAWLPTIDILKDQLNLRSIFRNSKPLQDKDPQRSRMESQSTFFGCF